ncbi:MAG TPA: ABC transporter permease, partial [Gemmatimonadaceae bacterium]|nr:ABC transporter permease [Gemmatimonadaceae bacterium]
EVTLRSDLRAVSPNFLDVLQIPLVQGRNFTRTDRAETPRVALVNQTLAKRLDASGNVIGQSIRIGNAVTSPLVEIVGVVADTRWWGTTLDPLNEVYIPLAQDRASFGFTIVQSSLSATEVTAAVRKSFYAAMPGASLTADRRAIPLEELIGRSIAGPRFSAALMASFSATALILAAIGLFGMVAYSASQRRRELGVRTALGARPRDLIVTSVRAAIVLTAVGIATGLAAAAYLTRFVESQLYAIAPLDLPTFATAAIVMLLAAACAAYVPARAAAHADPMQSLRYE